MANAWDELHARLRDEGQDPHVLMLGGGQLLCARHGARVLAVDGPGVEESSIFTADGPDGKLTGGDRLWLSPEVAWFWPSLADARQRAQQTASTPAAIDPGEYEAVHATPTRLTLRSLVRDLTDVRSGKRVRRLEVERSFAASTAPAALPDEVACLSFTIRNTLRNLEADAGIAVGAWDLLQVEPGEAGGVLTCPTTYPPEVRSYYDPFGERHVAVDGTQAEAGRGAGKSGGCAGVRFLIDGRRRIKMGLRAQVTTGRMGYYRSTREGWAVAIVRIFGPLPGEPYCDLPRDDPRHDTAGDTPPLDGDALQAYNDDGSAFGSVPGGSPTFGEMEHHDPCLLAGSDTLSRTGTSVTHIFAGPDPAVREAGRRLLGVEMGAAG